jgi:hypothetical protein
MRRKVTSRANGSRMSTSISFEPPLSSRPSVARAGTYLSPVLGAIWVPDSRFAASGMTVEREETP